METRKQFLKKISGGAAALTASTFFNPLKYHSLKEDLGNYSGTAKEIARNEDFWAHVQQAFTVDRSLINLNNGGVSPSPAFVQEAMKKHLDFSNQAPVYNMWRILEPRREGVRQRLARNFGVDTEEIAITRNASESLQICQFGFDLKAGDEVLTTDQDYPRMINTFKQRERREGIKLNQISIPVPAEDDAEIVRRFEEAITPNTKLILMCHIINLTGQILPVKKVVQMARKKGIPVIVDGAHAFAHFTFNHSDLDCDYYTSSLHKWLFAPHGTGMLYVRKNKIKDLWPLMAAEESQDEDIRKFEEIGTHPAANFLAIGEALTFHEGIGSARKEARLKHLNDLWIDELVDGDKVVLHTSRNPTYACGIATVEIKGMEPNDLNSALWRDYRIITTPINRDQFRGIRVTPNVYTTLEEIDRFISAMKDQIKKV
ncbi:aminotransferase class V-fold PLP-dependent enzyme [Gracilimonas sp.]|uniref:aminotransferase class V-fold PLP-dependent enzyme n=1 Tax=Gracilimonas sp. TaxID=1974203 RepID=UPI0032EC5104